MNEKTVIYYTSNTEDPDFEAKICANTLKQSPGLPIISVSQKPMDFGENICVGNVGHTYFNMIRQILLAAKAAKTEYVVVAESDFLYPPNYFAFEPTGAPYYIYDNVWIVYENQRLYSYRKKGISSGTRIFNREYLVSSIEKNLEGKPLWSDKEVVIGNKRGYEIFSATPEVFTGEIAAISFKTAFGMRNYTNVLHGRENISMKLPYWGHVANLRKEYLNQGA